MLVIPAIDILGGKCVRLFKGDYARVKQYAENPVEVAKRFVNEGAKYLHVVDLDGAKEGRTVNRELILDLAQSVNVPVQVGGGMRNYEDAASYLNAGIGRVILSTIALEDSDLLSNLVSEFGANRIVVSLDLKGGQIATKGWLEVSNKCLDQILDDLENIGIRTLIVTDIDRDGTLEGANSKVLEQFLGRGFEIISAGGVASENDVQCLKKVGVGAAICGKAIYEGRVSFKKNNLSKRVIACMDVDGGRVVKGVNFKSLRDAGDPVDLGKIYSESGADELVYLDISATVENRKNLIELVEKVARQVFIPFTVGGGVNCVEDIRDLLQAGADKVSLGSAAVLNPDLVREASQRFGAQCVVISLDCKRVDDGWELFIKGGREATGIDAIQFATRMEELGAGELLVNSLDKDGTKEGYDLELLESISEAVNIPVIASSGAGSKRDFLEAFEFADACLAASLFHYGEIEIADLKQYLSDNSLTIRL